jgi:hypothetical protein
MLYAVQVTGQTRRWFLVAEIPERDKMKKPIHRLLLPALLLSCSSLAFAGPVTTINFEQYSEYTQITTQYAGEGATFTNALQLVAPGYDYFDFPPTSGSGVITNDPGDPITVAFSVPVNSVSGFYADPYGVVVTAYSSTNAVLDTFNGAGIIGADDAFSVTSSGDIAYITISDLYGIPDDETVDDLSYSGSTNPVIPEPGSFVLLGTGLLSMAGAVRRKFAR